MEIQLTEGQRALRRLARVVRRLTAFCIAVAALSGCGDGEYQEFVESHAALRPGMTLREAFDAGLADYLASMGTKNVPGATLPDKRPVATDCARYVLDLGYSGTFRVRVYCGMNEPAAPQVIPEKSFKDKKEFLAALDTTYGYWARNMEFWVESPPRKAFGVYDHYRFTTDRDGRVATVTPLVVSRPGR